MQTGGRTIGRQDRYEQSTSIAVFCDYLEEGWPSMNLAAEMLVGHLRQIPAVYAEAVVPRFRRRASRLPMLGRRSFAANADRLLNRMYDYPRLARELGVGHEFYHVVDHSYSQLVHELPHDRAGVYCHDLDTFRCILEPHVDRRPRWFRAMTRRILRGMQSAAVVFHSTEVVREQLLRFGIVDPGRLIKAPYGYSEEFRVDAPPTCDEPDLPGPYVLHVGSCIPRKRIDVLLSAFLRLSQQLPDLQLVQVGGTWRSEDVELLRAVPNNRITQLRGIDRGRLASIYRKAELVMLPSETEGFGLPVIEAMACGTAVVASDIPAFREVGGDAVVYCPVGDVDQWVETIAGLLSGTRRPPTQSQRLAQAAKFSWKSHAETILAAYRRICGGR